MKGVMIQGTASDVGKSFMATALCRLAADCGYNVAPFKSQNMTSMTELLADGSELARSQVIQAEAAKQRPSVWMNPLVLKPSQGQIAETIVFGESLGTLKGADSLREAYYTTGVSAIKQALDKIKGTYDVLIAEGAGSPVEMNLHDRDLVNMTVADLADVPVIIVADIKQGGVFASIVGTLQLLSFKQRHRVQGLVINRFQGDPSAFSDGVAWLESYTGLPVLGVIPEMTYTLPEEDDLSREQAGVADQKTVDYDAIAETVLEHLDWNHIKQIMTGGPYS